jgi:hypothetical protein
VRLLVEVLDWRWVSGTERVSSEKWSETRLGFVSGHNFESKADERYHQAIFHQGSYQIKRKHCPFDFAVHQCCLS